MTVAGAGAAVGLPPRKRASPVTRWLDTAPPWAFALYGGLSAFGAYFAMYAYRKPFSAASYAHVAGWPFAIDFKIMLVIAQVAGYALSKVIGVKVVSEMPPAYRAMAILLLIGIAEIALVAFAATPPLLGVVALFLNGLALGMIWGLVFGFLEGRRLSEVLGAMLCASFILSSGVVKSAGEALLVGGWANERWMPAATGLLFAPLLLLSVWALAQLPPPNARDEIERAPRTPMDGIQRRRFFRTHAAGLIAIVGVYVMLTAFRDFRDNFAAEIWGELGYSGEAGIFTWSELPVAVIVLVALAMLIRVRDNRNGVIWNLILVAIGLAVMGLSTLGFQIGWLGPAAWMIAVGAGLYLSYTPFNALLFDRMIAATGSPGNAGFLIYVADASGYAGSVALLLVRNFAHVSLRWTQFLCDVAYVTCIVGLLATGYGLIRLLRSLPAGQPAATL
jgi:MFS family permease